MDEKKWWDSLGDRFDDIERHSKRLLMPMLLLAVIIFLAIAGYSIMRLTRIFDGVDAIVNTLNTDTLPKLSEQANAQIAAAGETQIVLRDDVHKLLEKGTATFDQLNQETIPTLTHSGDNLRQLIAGLNRELPPTLQAVRVDLDKLGSTIDEGTATLGQGRLVIEHADRVVQNAEQYVADDQAQVLEILKRQVKIHDNLVVISDPEAYKTLLKEGTGVTTELHGILADTHKVTTYISNELAPAPTQYSKNPVKATFQRAGRFLITVAKNGWVILRLVSLFAN